MKTLLYLYVAGAIATKLLVNDTPLDDTQDVLAWPLLWLNSTDGMLALLKSKFAGSVPSVQPSVFGENGVVIYRGGSGGGDIRSRCRCN